MASSTVPALSGERRDPESRRPITKALAFFGGAEAASIAQFLGRLRPAPLSPAVRARVIASLPAEGELRATDAERAKLAALEPIIDFHGREGVLEIKVIEVGHAFVGLHARTVLLVSRDALALVTPEELQALAAHELGHEYVWDEYWTAMTTQAHPRMQELELVCDGIAVMTLRALGLQTARLVDAVTKVTRYNERLGATANAGAYVSLEERRAFIEQMAGLIEGTRPRYHPKRSGGPDEDDSRCVVDRSRGHGGSGRAGPQRPVGGPHQGGDRGGRRRVRSERQARRARRDRREQRRPEIPDGERLQGADPDRAVQPGEVGPGLARPAGWTGASPTATSAAAS